MGLCPSMHHRSHDQEDLCPGGLCPGGLCPGGLRPGGSLSKGGSLSRGFSVQGVSVQGASAREGLCPGGYMLGRTPGQRSPYSNKRAVRILLECILVFNKFAMVT